MRACSETGASRLLIRQLVNARPSSRFRGPVPDLNLGEIVNRFEGAAAAATTAAQAAFDRAFEDILSPRRTSV